MRTREGRRALDFPVVSELGIEYRNFGTGHVITVIIHRVRAAFVPIRGNHIRHKGALGAESRDQTSTHILNIVLYEGLEKKWVRGSIIGTGCGTLNKTVELAHALNVGHAGDG